MSQFQNSPAFKAALADQKRRSGPVMVIAASRKSGRTYGYTYQLDNGRYTVVALGSDYQAAQRSRKQTIHDMASGVVFDQEMRGFA
jgi:hypothetical protein